MVDDGRLKFEFLFILSSNPIVKVFPVPVCPYTKISPFLLFPISDELEMHSSITYLHPSANTYWLLTE